ncbi:MULTISPECIES: hypothetical protein [unclassified Streptomyces]|uniref:hypothetical protein n=1 Tax=unclassified Streptomyces TaxID=2593676 RepID=UPI003817DB44
MLSTYIRPGEITLDTTSLASAMAEPETPVSDAPGYAPEGAGLLLLGLLLALSPSEPKEPKSR